MSCKRLRSMRATTNWKTGEMKRSRNTLYDSCVHSAVLVPPGCEMEGEKGHHLYFRYPYIDNMFA